MQDFYKRVRQDEGKTNVFGRKKGLEKVKDLGSLPYTMIHSGAGGLRQNVLATFSDKKKKIDYQGKINTAGLDSSKLKGKNVTDRVGDALLSTTNELVKSFNPSAGGFANASQLANAGSVFSAAGTVFESSVRKAFDGPAKSQTSRIDFPSPSSRLREFFYNAPGPYEAKVGDSVDHRASTLSKWIAINGLSKGFMPKGVVFSKTKKDEFGFSSIYAQKDGKKVGQFEYAEDRPGLIDVGDISVNKAFRGMGIGRGLYQEMIRRNAGKTITGQLLPQTSRFLQKIKAGEKVTAETLYPQIAIANLAKDATFEVWGHKGMDAEKMTKDQFINFINGKIKTLQSDPKKFKSFFGDIDADPGSGLGVKLDTSHSSGFVPNFASGRIQQKSFYSRGAQPWLSGKKIVQSFDPLQGISFKNLDLNKIRSGRIIHSEGVAGNNVYSIEEFKKIF